MKILIVVEHRNNTTDRFYAAFDLNHIEGSLRHTGIADSIDILYYSDYTEFDNVIFNYCVEQKPDVALLSVQSTMVGSGILTPSGLERINRLGIKTVMFWWSIYADTIAERAETYSPTLHIFGGADKSSHKPVKFDNIIYNAVPYDDGLFDKPDGARDIPVGFLASLTNFRAKWMDSLSKHGIHVRTGGGQLLDGYDTSCSSGIVPLLWLPYEEYLRITSRMKIALDFTTGLGPMNNPSLTSLGQVERVASKLTGQVRGGLGEFIKHPRRWPDALSAIKRITTVSMLKKREMIRSRLLEALWCRTFILEEYSPVTESFFIPYSDYVPFYTLKDLVEKIRYYLWSAPERDRIRLHGRATMEKYYSAHVYWQNIFEYIGK